MFRSVRSMCALLLCVLSSGIYAQEKQWLFRVLLDGEPIGTHRFVLRNDGAGRELRSEAQFDVKFLFITAYRYRHEATENWQGDCLQSMTAKTNDGGEQLFVEALRGPTGLSVRTVQGRSDYPGCIKSFAYWNPAILQAEQLLNAQNGRLQSVRFERLGETRIQLAGQMVAAQKIRLSGPEQPLDLWYSADGDWLALSSTLAGGRQLYYQRQM